MKGIILSAGKGTRMKEMAGKDVCKTLLPLGDLAVIEYGISSMISMNVKKIYIVANENFKSEFKALEEKYFPIVNVLFIGRTNHIMDSMDLISKHVQKDKEWELHNYILWLGDNVFVGEDHKRAIARLCEYIPSISKQPFTGFITSKVCTPTDFIAKNKNSEWEEKPAEASSNEVASGVFMINAEMLRHTDNRESMNRNGEYTVFDSWMKNSEIVSDYTTDKWFDVGTPERYLEIKALFDK